MCYPPQGEETVNQICYIKYGNWLCLYNFNKLKLPFVNKSGTVPLCFFC